MNTSQQSCTIFRKTKMLKNAPFLQVLKLILGAHFFHAIIQRQMKISPWNQLQMATNILHFQWKEAEPKYLNPYQSYSNLNSDLRLPEIFHDFISRSRFLKLSMVMALRFLILLFITSPILGSTRQSLHIKAALCVQPASCDLWPFRAKVWKLLEKKSSWNHEITWQQDMVSYILLS